MLKFNSLFKGGTKKSKESSPHIKLTEKSIEGINKNRNMSLDFSNTPLKQNKKIIKRNTRTNSFNSLLINQTESGLYSPYPYMSGLNPSGNHKLMINKNLSGFKATLKPKNKSFNLKKGLMNLNKPKLPSRKKASNKRSKRNFLNSYFINPSNIHISFNTVGNNFQFEQYLKQNKNNHLIKTDLFHNNKILNNNEMNKSIHILHKTKSLKKFNLNNEINNVIKSFTEEQQKLILKDFKLFLNIFPKIKRNKNEEIIINDNDINDLQKGGLIGQILCENFKIKQKNEELESKVDNITKELEQIKNDKKDIRVEMEKKDKIIKDMNLKMTILTEKFKKYQKMINNRNNNNNNEELKSCKIGESFSNKSSSKYDLDNISLDNNVNMNINMHTDIGKNPKNKSNVNKLEKNKSDKNLKINNKVGLLNFNSKVGTYNFNDEFLKDYEYFSESWRKEVDKMLQRRGNSKKIPEIKIKSNNKK
jgi:hypothetical protein